MIKKPVTADEDFGSNEALILTPSALLAFLSQIEELDTKGNLSIEEGDGTLTVSIGDSTYVLESGASISDVEGDVVDSLDDINDDGYDEIDAETVEDESVEGGIIKELIKTLAVGGLVRLTKNALLNS